MKRLRISVLAAALLCGAGPVLGQSSLPGCNEAEYTSYLNKIADLLQAHKLSLKAEIVLIRQSIEALNSATACWKDRSQTADTCNKLKSEAELAKQAANIGAVNEATKLKTLEEFQRQQRFVTPSGRVCLLCKQGYRFDENYFKC
jgi:hypothetical protein